MPKKTQDLRVAQGRLNRNRAIRKYFEKRYNTGMRMDVVVSEIISIWGLTEGTITQIVKKRGYYKSDE